MVTLPWHANKYSLHARESYCRLLLSFLCLCDVFLVLIMNSLVHWFCIGILGLVPFQIATFYPIKCWWLVKEGFLAAQCCVCSVGLLHSTVSIFQSSVNLATLCRYHSSCCALTNLKFWGGRFFATVGKGLWCILLSLICTSVTSLKTNFTFPLIWKWPVWRVFFGSAVSVNSTKGKCLLLNLKIPSRLAGRPLS